MLMNPPHRASPSLRNASSRAWLATLMSVVLLLAPGARAHLHLCFDGSEAPSTFHLSDAEMHHDADGGRLDHPGPGIDALHSDSDVAVAGDALSKGKLEWQMPFAPQLAAPAFALPQQSRLLPPSSLDRVPLSPTSFLRPPLRGPPSLTSV